VDAAPSGIARWTRRELLGLAAATVAGACFQRSAATPDSPNVIFISIDDLNDWIPMLGGYAGTVHAPHLARLAARGTVFTNAHSQSVSCMASRASAMTGMWPETTGIVGVERTHDFRKWAPDAITIPAAFRAAGYEAIGLGKVFHHPDPISWDRSVHSWPDPEPARSPLSGVRFPYYFDWGPLDLPVHFMGDHRMVSAALEVLRKRSEREKPLFLGIGIVKPHPPWIVPREFFELYPLDEIVVPSIPEDDLEDVPAVAASEVFGLGYQEQLERHGAERQAIQAFLATLSYVDSLLGMIVDELDRGGAWERSVVVLWSDHGLHLGEKRRWHKFTLWEESTRVPLVVCAPGVGPGSRCARAVGLIDLFPTLVEICGIPRPLSLEGESLVPLLVDPTSPRQRPAMTTWRQNRAVRSDRWRYIRYVDGSEELYDHDADPREWVNLAGDPRFATVKADLGSWLDGDRARSSMEPGAGG
jgi:arylsulfatase A-like enzyme